MVLVLLIGDYMLFYTLIHARSCGKKLPPKEPKNGEERIIQRFLWLPLHRPNSWGGWYTKWFEWAKIRQQFWDGQWYDSHWVD